MCLGYIKYRELCGLSVPSSWEEKPDDISNENWENLQLVYDNIEDIDAFTGGVSEDGDDDRKSGLKGLFQKF